MNRNTSTSLDGCLRQIMTPQAWKSLHVEAGDFEKTRSRWTVPAIITTGLAIALASESTLRERFDAAIGLNTHLRPKRRRCGQTVEGYLTALRDLPMDVFDVLRRSIWKSVLRMGTDPARVGRWACYALDGTKQNLPRTTANEKYFGAVTKEPPLPQILTVAAVALGQRLLADWAQGGAHDHERDLALAVIGRLPVESMAVLDAGFTGYEFIQNVRAQGKHLLLRVGANVSLWTENVGNAERNGGEVWLWPNAQRKNPPICLRLIKFVRTKRKRIKAKNKHGNRKWKTVKKRLWLLTDILNEKALSKSEAAEIFRRRWGGNEIRFRDWKCTLKCDVLFSRTPELAQRECVLSLCGLMLLNVLAMHQRKARRQRFQVVSIALAIKCWRKAVRIATRGKSTAWFRHEISNAIVDTYERQRPKVKRRWPKRKEHNMPGCPTFRRLVKVVKSLGVQKLEEATA